MLKFSLVRKTRSDRSKMALTKDNRADAER